MARIQFLSRPAKPRADLPGHKLIGQRCLVSSNDSQKRFHPFLHDAGMLCDTAMAWRPEVSQFYSQLLNSAESGNYPDVRAVLHAEDNEMSRSQNRIEQGDLK